MSDTMTNTMTSTASGGRPDLQLRWVPVRDARGRVHMEAQWSTGTASVPRTHRPAA